MLLSNTNQLRFRLHVESEGFQAKIVISDLEGLKVTDSYTLFQKPIILINSLFESIIFGIRGDYFTKVRVSNRCYEFIPAPLLMGTIMNKIEKGKI